MAELTMIEEYLEDQKLHRKKTNELAAKLEPHKLTSMEAEALANCNEKNMGAIAQALGVSLPQITALCRKLVGLKYAKYVSLNPDDRRQRSLKLTPKGKALLEEAQSWKFTEYKAEDAGNE